MPQPEARSRAALLISAALHVLLIYALLRVTAHVMPPTNSPIGEAFRLALGGGGGGGSGGASFAAAPPPPPAPAAEIPPPPKVVPPEVVPPPPTPVAETPVTAYRDTTPTTGAQSAAGSGGGTGGGAGTGAGPGTGSGVGPGSGSGTGGGSGNGRGGSPPQNRVTILPPLDPPKSLKGKTLEVTFSIDALGRVLDVLVAPPIADKGFAKKFDEIMRGYDWRPARDSLGRAVAGSLTMTISF